MMGCNISIKTTFLFLSFSFFITAQSILYSMDLPQNKIVEYTSIIPGNNEPEKKNTMLGGFLGSLPTEVVLYFFKKSTPAMRNGLRVNKFLSELFSWESVHPFMLCKELIAHPNDIQSLIVQCMHKPDKSENEKGFIESYHKRFFSYQILGEPRFLVLEYTEAKPDLYMFNHASRKKKNIHPLLEVCLARNSAMVEDYLKKVDYKIFNVKNGLSLDIFRAAIQILVQNDDSLSLNLILNSHKIDGKYMKSAIIPACSKFIQAALVVCVKPEIMQQLIYFYKIKSASAMLSTVVDKEENWIAKMLEANPILMNQYIKKDYLYDIIKFYHPILECMHQDKKSNYHANLSLLFNKTTLKNLGIAKEKKQEVLSENKNKQKSHNKCMIM